METGQPHESARLEKGWPIWAPAVLAALAQTGKIGASCEAANVDPSTVFRLRQNDAEFSAAFGEARARAAELLEDEAFRRAHDGIVELVVGKDGEVHENRKYSDTLLIFLLKGALPEKYRERFDTKLSGSLDVTSIVEAAHATLGGNRE